MGIHKILSVRGIPNILGGCNISYMGIQYFGGIQNILWHMICFNSCDFSLASQTQPGVDRDAGVCLAGLRDYCAGWLVVSRYMRKHSKEACIGKIWPCSTCSGYMSRGCAALSNGMQRIWVGETEAIVMLLGRRVVGMDRMAAVKIVNVIMAEVLRWWKHR